MAKPSSSFLDRVQPSRPRERLLDWPFETSEPFRLRMRVLGADELEAAHLEALDHFRAIKVKLATTDDPFVARERVGLVWRAYRTIDGDPLELDSATLAKWPAEMLGVLYSEFSRFQGEVTQRPMNQEQLDEWVDGLKKNTHVGLLPGLPTSWLIKLCTTLASQLAASTTANERG